MRILLRCETPTLCSRRHFNRTAVEELLRAGFTPTRTFVLAYGIDEERGGISVSIKHTNISLCSHTPQGATAIRDYLLATYGEYAFSILIDEGGKSPQQVTSELVAGV